MTYVDNELMRHRAKTQRYVTQTLPEHLDYHIARCRTLNLKYSPFIAELMPLATGTKTPKREEMTIRLYDRKIDLTNYLKSLGIWINDWLSY